jgi:hypothetical protein
MRGTLMKQRTRRILGHPAVGIAALWATLSAVFLLTGGGDRQDLAQLSRVGVLVSAGVLWGHGSRSQRAGTPSDVTSTGTGIARRVAVLGSATAVALVLIVLVLTPRGATDWGTAAAVWGAGFAVIAFADGHWRASRRRLHHEPPSPGSTGYPSR